MADFHDIDAMRGTWGDFDELPADVVAGPAELVALDGRHNKALDAAHPHPQGQQLHGKGLPRPGGAQEHQVGVLVDLAVEQIYNAQGVVCLLYTSLVLDILMAGNLGFALEERLKHDNCFSGQRRSVKGEQHFNCLLYTSRCV